MHTVEHRLRFVLNSTTLRIIKIEEKATTEDIMKFNKEFCGEKRVVCFVLEVSEVTKIPVFNVPLTPNSTVHKVLLCEVAVGKSVYVTNQYADDLDVPIGAGSFIVRDVDSTGYLSDENQDIRRFSYVIKERARILPLYEAKFEYDEVFERNSRGRIVCNKCTKVDAVVFCPSERANFCKECDEKVHDDIFLQVHERKYFAEVGQKKFFCCTDHPTKTIDYFCSECKVPLCTECKITGSHSVGDKSIHSIANFIDACKDAVQYISQTNSKIEEALQKVDSETSAYLSGLNGYSSGVSLLRKHLQKEFKVLMQQLDCLESQKRQVINAQLVALFQKKEDLLQMLKYPAILDPADILVSLKNIEEQRTVAKTTAASDICKFDHKKPEVHGRIEIRPPKAVDRDDVPLRTTTLAMDWRIKTMHLSNSNVMPLE